MWTMRYSDVPSFLKEGSFYHNLDCEDDGVFEVPEDSFKPDLIIESEHDLSLLLRTVQYWGLSEIPFEVVSYVISTDQVVDLPQLLLDFPDVAPLLSNLAQVKSSRFCDSISLAIKLEMGLRVVQLLHSLKYVLSGDCCEAAAAVGDLESLTYLHSEGCSWDERTTTAAVLNHHCDCLQYALDFNCSKDAKLMDMAAGTGSIDALKCLHVRNCCVLWTKDTTKAAILARKVDALRFLVDSGCALPDDPCRYAAMVSDLDCLTYLRQNGHPLTTVCAVYASLGHLPVLRYLHEQGCPWDQRCCSVAALGNHIDCLQYLHENGCPWNDTAITAALATGSWECLWYALRHGCSVLYLLPIASFGWALVFIFYIACVKERDPAVWYTTYTYDFLLLAVVSAQYLKLFHEKFGDYIGGSMEPKTVGSIISYYQVISLLAFFLYMCYVWLFAWPTHLQQ